MRVMGFVVGSFGDFVRTLVVRWDIRILDFVFNGSLNGRFMKKQLNVIISLFEIFKVRCVDSSDYSLCFKRVKKGTWS